MSIETGVPIDNTSFATALAENDPQDENAAVDKETDVSIGDAKIFDFSKHDGWVITKEYINALISEYEEKIGLQSGELPEAYGARRLAADSSISDLKKVIFFVEDIANYVRDKDQNRKERG